MWHFLPKKNKRAAVVKITRESEDTIVAAMVLYGGMQRLYIKALATLQMTPLTFVDRGVMELAHHKDDKCYARLLGERHHDGLEIDGPAIDGSNWSTRRRGFCT